ncbi:MAG: hypothetical protein GY699_16115 [Desulfobacteraceae bacterium]|jgi:membrane protein DedA with SNARE-associated domain|nr:hypothetical protein [Desulfobacteraceae bacterium]
MSNLDLYSVITIALISVGGFASLAIWYWLGRRPLRQVRTSVHPIYGKSAI